MLYKTNKVVATLGVKTTYHIIQFYLHHLSGGCGHYSPPYIQELQDFDKLHHKRDIYSFRY